MRSTSYGVVRLLIGAVISLGPHAVAAQDFPAKAIRFIVPNTPGSGPDILARLVAPEMSKMAGQSVVVENKPGADNIIGLEFVAKQMPADGYTVAVVVASQLAILPVVKKELRFDPLRDLPPAIGLVEGKYIFGSSAGQPWKTFNEMVSYARANPGKLNYGSASPAGLISMEALLQDLGLKVIHIPYSAAGPYVLALLSGDIHMGFVGETTVASYGEKFRVLGVSGNQRSLNYRDSPTFAELGRPFIPGLSYTLNVRADTAKPTIDALYSAASRALRQPELRAQLAKLQLDITSESPETAAKNLVAAGRLYAEIAKRIGILPQ